MLELGVLVVETSGAEEEQPMTMVARMMDRGRALVPQQEEIVDRCGAVEMIAAMIVDRCDGEEIGMSVTIVGRCGVEIGRRCGMVTGVVPAVPCAVATDRTVAMEEIVGEVTLVAVETAGMIVADRDAMVETAAICGVVDRSRMIVGVVAAVAVLEAANPVETGETVRRNRQSQGMNHGAGERRGLRKPARKVPMRMAGQT